MGSCSDYRDQCFLIYQLTALSKVYKDITLNNSGDSHIKSAMTIMDGDPATFVSRFNRTRKMEPFLDLTTAQRSLLVPKLKASLHLRKNGKIIKSMPYVFGDAFTEREVNRLLGGQGRHHAVGIQSFTMGLEGEFTFNSGHVITATLTLHANSIDDLFEAHPPGTAQYYTLMVPGVADKAAKMKDSRTKVKHDTTKVKNSVEHLITFNVGWSSPENSDGLISEQLKAAIDECSVVASVSPNSHNITINENGTVSVSVSYTGHMQATMRSYRADIFNYNKQLKDILDGKSKIGVSDDVKKKARNADIKAYQADHNAAQEGRQSGAGGTMSHRAGIVDELQKAAQDLASSADESAFDKKLDFVHGKMAEEGKTGTAGAKAIIVEEQKRVLKRNQIQKLFEHIEKKGSIFFAGVQGIQTFLHKYCEEREKLEMFAKQAEKNLKAFDMNQAVSHYENLQELLNNQRPVIKSYSDYSPPGSSVSQESMKAYDNATKGNLQAEAKKLDKIHGGTSNTTSATDALKKVPFVFLGDILDAALSMVDVSDPALLNSKELNYRMILGPIQYVDPTSKITWSVNMADLPVALHDFQKWLNEKIIKMGAEGMTFDKFANAVMSDLILKALGDDCFFPGLNQTYGPGKEKLYFSTLEISVNGKRTATGYEDPLKGVSRINIKDFKAKYYGNDTIRKDKGEVPPGSVYTYLVCAATNAPPQHLTGHLMDDLKNGVYHFALGMDKGLLLKADIQQVKSPEYEALQIITTSNPLEQMAFSYTVNMSMIGNLFFQPGSTLFFNPSIGGLGDPRNQSSYASRLNLGGYFDVQGVNHSWTPANGWSTEVSAISSAPPQKSTPPVILKGADLPISKKSNSVDKTPDSDKSAGAQPDTGASDVGPLYDTSAARANEDMVAAVGANMSQTQRVMGSSMQTTPYVTTPSTYTGPIPRVPEEYTRSTYESVSGCRKVNPGSDGDNFYTRVECYDPLQVLPPRIPEEAIEDSFTNESARIILSFLEETRPIGAEAPGPFDLMQAFSSLGVIADNHMEFYSEGDDIAIFEITKTEQKSESYERGRMGEDTKLASNYTGLSDAWDVEDAATWTEFTKYNYYCYRNVAHGWFIYQFAEART